MSPPGRPKGEYRSAKHEGTPMGVAVTTAVVLAGGLGTRLRSAVPDLPKPMAPVAGQPFLAHLLDHWIGQGVRRFVLSVGYRHEAIRSHFGIAYRGAAIDYAVEATPLGTGGALRLAADGLDADERFLLLNGDTWFGVDLARLGAFAAKAEADWCFSLFRTAEQDRYLGIELGEGGRIEGLRARIPATGGLANGGAYLVHPRALAGLAPGTAPVSLENDLFPRFLAAGQRFVGLPCDVPFIDIGVPADWRRAADVISSRHPEPTHALHH